jgi:hypothetical protein
VLDYKIDVNGDLLFVTTTGYDDNVDEAVAYYESLISVCVDNQCRRILIDESQISSVLDKVSQYQMVQRLISHVPYDLAIAFVFSPELFEETSFGVLVAENRGINVRAFTTLEEASEWLQIDPEQ